MKIREYLFHTDLLFLVIFLGTITTILLFGGISFTRRYTKLLLCSYDICQDCNKNLMLSISPDPTAQRESVERPSVRRVVYLGLFGDRIWTWTADNLLEAFSLDNETRYGIAVLMEDSKLTKGRTASMLQDGRLVVIETPMIEINGKTLLVENPPGSLTRENFKAIVKGGNLLQIIYNKDTRAMTGILLLDFSRI